MVQVHIWVRRKEGQGLEEFRDRWLTGHAPLVRDGYRHLRSYVVNLVTRVPEGQEAPYDGVAELTWDDRDGLRADLASEAARRATEDLAEFAGSFGLLFVERHVVK